MRALHVSFFVDPERRPPRLLLEHWFSLVDVSRAAATAGIEVGVVQASTVAGRIEKEGVTFHFVTPDEEGTLLSTSTQFRDLVSALSPDVVHVHGLGFPLEVIELNKLAPNVPILLQDHANRIPRIWRRRPWRRAADVAAGASFCSAEQARPFVSAGILGPGVEIFEIPESTSRFAPGDQREARATTYLHGDPAILWVGHFDANKDPLTVLEGLGRAVRDLPGLQIWCCYGSAPLLPDVQRKMAGNAALRERVHLLGRVPHERVEWLMRAADIFVLGSHREGCSFSVIEALATGLEPVVTDIPANRALTGNGSAGETWRPGDASSFRDALLAAALKPRDENRRRLRKYFEDSLSATALGHRLLEAYSSMLKRPRSASTTTQNGPERHRAG